MDIIDMLLEKFEGSDISQLLIDGDEVFSKEWGEHEARIAVNVATAVHKVHGDKTEAEIEQHITKALARERSKARTMYLAGWLGSCRKYVLEEE